MQDLKVTLVQTALHWEDVELNLAHFDNLLSKIEAPTDLIILPEMFSTGFSMNTGLAEEMDSKTMQWMHRKSDEVRSLITGSLIIKEQDKFYNRLIWMAPSGEYQTYDKRHLFGMGNEPDFYTAGNTRLIITLKGWQINPQICYDLRFPVWNRNRGDFDCQIFIANWPERRNFAWKNLLQARAIENQAYVIGVNRIGNDGNSIYHAGDSAIIDPMGEVIFTEADTEFVRTFSISRERLNYVRNKMSFLKDADNFTINLE